MPLLRADGREAMRGEIQTRKRLLVRHVPERALERVDPAVIGANERLPLAILPEEPRPAVATRVPESAHDAVPAAHDDQRYTGELPRHRGPRRFYLAHMNERDRQPVEERRPLAREA